MARLALSVELPTNIHPRHSTLKLHGKCKNKPGEKTLSRRAIRLCSALAMAVSTSVAILTSWQPAAADPGLAGRSVFLDPGHNGISDSSLTQQVPNGRGGTKDCQTTGTATDDGYPEHAFNWDVAIRVQEALQSMGADVQLSRPNDSGVGPCVDQRAAEANASRSDAVVSIHADGGPAWGKGFHVNYSAPPLNAIQTTSAVELATTMRDVLLADGLADSDYAGANGLYGRSDLAGLNLAECPSVLVELGNMKNPNDAARMESPEGRAFYAKAITEGIVAYLLRQHTDEIALEKSAAP
ncbi:MAG: Rv3717 family N-acetylmuramoyl-L-alanine amidase [Fimbriimonadaceae bacterium]|nr:Rv3717 family N-acetylmuramoyl-L-alanine amidase [Fimbriimonadaceae bacterium]